MFWYFSFFPEHWLSIFSGLWYLQHSKIEMGQIQMKSGWWRSMWRGMVDWGRQELLEGMVGKKFTPRPLVFLKYHCFLYLFWKFWIKLVTPYEFKILRILFETWKITCQVSKGPQKNFFRLCWRWDGVGIAQISMAGPPIRTRQTQTCEHRWHFWIWKMIQRMRKQCLQKSSVEELLSGMSGSSLLLTVFP